MSTDPRPKVEHNKGSTMMSREAFFSEYCSWRVMKEKIHIYRIISILRGLKKHEAIEFGYV